MLKRQPQRQDHLKRLEIFIQHDVSEKASGAWQWETTATFACHLWELQTGLGEGTIHINPLFGGATFYTPRHPLFHLLCRGVSWWQLLDFVIVPLGCQLESVTFAWN